MLKLLVLVIVIALAVYVARMYLNAHNDAKDLKANTNGDVGGSSQSALVTTLEGRFLALKPGDVVNTEGGDRQIRGTVTFDERNEKSFRQLFSGEHIRQWLSVKQGDGVELSVWHTIELNQLRTGAAGDDVVEVDSVIYRQIDRGQARYSTTGDTGMAPFGSIDHIDYAAEGGKLLRFERPENSDWILTIGRKSLPAAFEIRPV